MLACLSVLISISCIEDGGIVSPLVLGVLLLLLARAAIIADRWQRAILPIGLITLAHPATLAVMALWMPRLAAQFHQAQALAGFALNEVFIVAAAALTLVGGHMIWALRRQVFETRSLGRYRLKRRIGAGGMGEVWAAHHHALRRDVAVKILRPESSGNPSAVARFEREVRATAELVHPHTVRVFDYGVTEDGLWYYAMELLSGADLGALVTREGPLPPARAALFLWQAAKALAEAHGRGIVHRDLKPENLFVTRVGAEGEFIKVLDFGLAKLAQGERSLSLTEQGWTVGTPRWASPEMAVGDPAGPASDVYGLGAVLYFALTGTSPFEYDDLGKMLRAHVHEVPALPSVRLGSPVPPELEAVVMRCLAKEPEARYADATALARALEHALARMGGELAVALGSTDGAARVEDASAEEAVTTEAAAPVAARGLQTQVPGASRAPVPGAPGAPVPGAPAAPVPGARGAPVPGARAQAPRPMTDTGAEQMSPWDSVQDVTAIRTRSG